MTFIRFAANSRITRDFFTSLMGVLHYIVWALLHIIWFIEAIAMVVIGAITAGYAGQVIYNGQLFDTNSVFWQQDGGLILTAGITATALLWIIFRFGCWLKHGY